MVYWEYMYHKKQTQINKDNIHENIKRVDHDYQVRYKVILTNNYAFKYETPYNGPFEITWCWINGTVTLQCGAIKIRHNTRHINPYKSDTNVEDIKC